MPWLAKKEEPSSWFYVHVPRCGGTSLSHHNKVYTQAGAELGPIGWFGMMWVAQHYYKFEKLSFPAFHKYDNIVYLIQLAIALVLFYVVEVPVLPVIQFVFAGLGLFVTIFMSTPPYGCRMKYVRRLLSIFTGQMICFIMRNKRWVCGVGDEFYMHLTATQAIEMDCVDKTEIETRSFATVRNPYARFVSMYVFNKRPFESFDEFTKDCHKIHMEEYRKHGRTSLWYIYCHLLPMTEYTHSNGTQLVPVIIKLEEISKLHNRDDVPKEVKAYFAALPKRNSRKKKKSHWSAFYSDPETIRMVQEMFSEDFETFGYEKDINAYLSYSGAGVSLDRHESTTPTDHELPEELDGFPDDRTGDSSSDAESGASSVTIELANV